MIQGNGLKKNAKVLPADNFKAKSGNKQTHTHWHHHRFSLHSQKAATMGSRDKPYGTPKTFTKEIGRGRFTRNLQRLEERRPEFRMQRLQLGSLAAVSLPLNPCLRTPPPQERKSEIHQKTSHPNISRSLFNSRTKKISWTQKT